MIMSVQTRQTSRIIFAAAGIVLALLLGFGANQASAADVFVSVLGSDTAGDGSVGNPYATVQYAVDRAVSADEVHVGVGTFDGDVAIKDGVSLFGTGPDGTTLLGTGMGPVVSLTNVGGSTSLSGFTITGGGRVSAGLGGGIYCDASMPLITGNVISENSASHGGGIYSSSSTPTISGNTIADNASAGSGGGIYCTSGSPAISSNTIARNTAVGGGGGISYIYSHAVIANNVLTSNTAYSGGGILCSNDHGSPMTGYQEFGSVISSNSVTGNIASHEGGGILAQGFSDTTVTGNTIADNSASAGGGVFGGSTAFAVTGNTIERNVASVDGGGILYINSTYSSVAIANNVLADNTAASSGGGVYLASRVAPSVVNNTITGNSAVTGGGIASAGGGAASPAVTNCILWGNGDDLLNCTAAYSCIENPGSASGPGSFSTPPSFVGTATGDYRLAAGSSCIDAGSPTDAPATDKDGARRPRGRGWDVGAYEFAPPTHAINAAAGAHGSIDPSTPQAADEGTDQTFTFSPDIGYCVATLSIDGGSAETTTATSYTFTDVRKGHAIAVAFAEAGTLSGRVTSGVSDLSGVSVSVPGYPVVTTSGSGAYTVSGVLPGTYDVSYTKSGYTSQTLSVRITADTTLQDVSLAPLLGVLRGTVTKPDGVTPIEGVFVAVGSITSTLTDSAGKFSIDVAAGSYAIVYSRNGYATQTLTDVPITPGETTIRSIVLTELAVAVPRAPTPTTLSLPSLSPSRLTHGRYATFTAQLTPGAAAAAATTNLALYRYETKTVRKKVGRKWKKVKVKYWRLRTTRTMTPSADGRLTLRYKLPYSGKWKAVASYAGSPDYSPITSATKSFTVK